MIAVEKVQRDEGRRRIDKGNASALLTIPKGFTTALFENSPPSSNWCAIRRNAFCPT
jgi:hypothetical protein